MAFVGKTIWAKFSHENFKYLIGFFCKLQSLKYIMFCQGQSIINLIWLWSLFPLLLKKLFKINKTISYRSIQTNFKSFFCTNILKHEEFTDYSKKYFNHKFLIRKFKIFSSSCCECKNDKLQNSNENEWNFGKIC